MLLGLVLTLLVSAAPPSTREHFRRETVPGHVFLVVDPAGETVIRADDAGAAEGEALPAGSAERLLVALAGLETGTLDADRRVPCDSTCWAGGTHGRPDLVEAIALACDSWFRDTEADVGHAAIAAHAERLGLGPYPAAGDAGWSLTARQWIGLWPRLASAVDLRPGTATTLLAAAGMSVTSPRGVARPLHDPTQRVRAVVGVGDEGAWVTGTLERRGPIRWTFALYLRGGSARLAAVRAAHLLEETIRTHEAATAERGGRPPAAIDENP